MGIENLLQKPFLILLIVIIGISVSSAAALFVHNENTNIQGTLKVTAGEIAVERTGATSGITVQNDGDANVIKFSDLTPGEEQIFQFRQVGAGDRLDINDVTNGIVILSAEAGTGNVGIGTTSPSEELEVNGQILGDPIVGKWRPDSTTTNTNTEYVKWDIEDFNTDPTYFGFTAGQDHIKILKSGTYQITANVLTFSGALGEAMAWELLRTSSSSVDQEYLCRNLATLAGAFYQSSCTTIETFASNEKSTFT